MSRSSRRVVDWNGLVVLAGTVTLLRVGRVIGSNRYIEPGHAVLMTVATRIHRVNAFRRQDLLFRAQCSSRRRPGRSPTGCTGTTPLDPA
jgi:hypothetical protein